MQGTHSELLLLQSKFGAVMTCCKEETLKGSFFNYQSVQSERDRQALCKEQSCREKRNPQHFFDEFCTSTTLLSTFEANSDVPDLIMVWTPAHTAARDGDVKRLTRCLNQIQWLQKIDINSQTKSGHTALHMSAANGHLDAMQEALVILSQKGVDKNPRTLQGNTPLHLACLGNRQSACKVLVNHGADLESKNNYGLTPADVCPVEAEPIRQMLAEAAVERERRGQLEMDEV